MTTNVYKEISNFGEQFLSDKKVKETFKTSRGLKSNHHENVFLGHLNVNSIRKIFESLKELTKDTSDIFLACDSKLNSNFPDS